MTLSNKELLQLNYQGFIPGPNESEDEFLERISYNQNLRQTLSQENIPIANPIFEIEQCSEVIKPYNFSLPWLLVMYSNYQLFPWHGACAWIFQMTSTSPIGAFLQLRSTFKQNKTLWKIYNKNELLEHECCHAARMAFDENVFEEFLAYQISPSFFRRIVGPLFKSSYELVITLLLFTILICTNIFAIFFESYEAQNLYKYALAAFFIFMTALCIRLFFRHNQFLKCKNNLNKFTPLSQEIVFRLTDKEIISFGKMNKEQISQYLQKDPSLRCRLLYLLFTQNTSGPDITNKN